MKSATITRLTALEARSRAGEPQASLTPLHALQVRALAVLAGNLGPKEAPAEGLARALGYDRPGELREAMREKVDGRGDGPDGFDIRWRRALLDLCERFDLDPATAGEADLEALLARYAPNERIETCPT